jgi:heme-degrading monooxygenase HmoA
VVTVGLYYQVRPGKEQVFQDTVNEVIELLAQNPGHVQSLLYRAVKDPRSYAIISEWSSQKAFTDFIKSDTFRQVTEFGASELLEQRPRHKVYGGDTRAL